VKDGRAEARYPNALHFFRFYSSRGSRISIFPWLHPRGRRRFYITRWYIHHHCRNFVRVRGVVRGLYL